MLYDSLHQKLLKLPDSVQVYPAHGAGSLCGRNMRADRTSTIGTERLTNYALQIKGREEFIQQLTTNLPTRPDYFLQDAEINRSGAPALTDLLPLPALTPGDVKSRLDRHANVLDVRPAEQFATGHVPGSINIALSGQFASWAGNILGIDSDPILIAETEELIEEARTRLARVGIEGVRGYLAGGVSAWQKAGLPIAVTSQISAHELGEKLRNQSIQVLDVRREGEWQAGHIPQAKWHALDVFPHQLPAVDDARPLAIHCKSGYRSMIACSLLERAGHHNLIDVVGGYDAWHAAGLPEVSEQPVKA
jgi:rhodanese-related sulfurtransferase